MSKKCDICNSKLSIFHTEKILDGNICMSCCNLCTDYKTQTIEKMKEYWITNNERKNQFKSTYTFKNIYGAIEIDSENNFFSYLNKIYKFDEIINYEISSINDKVITKNKGGITRAVVGNAIAGPLGGVIGASTSSTESTVKKGDTTLILNLSTYAGKEQKTIINPPSGLIEFFDKCLIREKDKHTNSISSDSISEIKKLKELFDIGAITEEEFSLKKKKILDI